MREQIPLKIGNKIGKYPLIQGGMGVGISLSGLAGAVAKEGGIGIISAAQIGFREADFDDDSRVANLRAMKTEYDKARAIAPEGIIGFNIMVAMLHYEEYVKAAVDAGADLIISGAGLPVELPKYVEGLKTCIAPIVSTDKSAKVILKYWDRKYNRTADLIVIEGPKAGGHLGFKKEQLEEFDDDSYGEEIQKIIETVSVYEEKYKIRIPIVVAGGIENEAQVRHVMDLGADGVQVASRFVPTKECDADIRYKECYINASKEDIVIVKSPVGMPGRAICNAFIKRVEQEGKVPHGKCHQCLHKCNPAEIPYCITEALINTAKGNVEEGLLFCGAYAYKTEKIETVKSVIDSLFPSLI
ncbi:MAG: nitronate monooxygenase family protein [Lachnospiraceae bacterium]